MSILDEMKASLNKSKDEAKEKLNKDLLAAKIKGSKEEDEDEQPTKLGQQLLDKQKSQSKELTKLREEKLETDKELVDAADDVEEMRRELDALRHQLKAGNRPNLSFDEDEKMFVLRIPYTKPDSETGIICQVAGTTKVEIDGFPVFVNAVLSV